MREELRFHRLLLTFIAVWITIFLGVVFLFWPRSELARFDAAAVLILNLVVSAALGFVGMAELILGASFAKQHRREFAGYTILGWLSVGCCIFLSVLTEVRLSIISMVLAPQAILFGVMQIRIGSGFERHPAQKRSLIITGIGELLCGLLLGYGYFLSAPQVLSLMTIAAIVSLAQLVPFLFFPPISEGSIRAH